MRVSSSGLNLLFNLTPPGWHVGNPCAGDGVCGHRGPKRPGLLLERFKAFHAGQRRRLGQLKRRGMGVGKVHLPKVRSRLDGARTFTTFGSHVIINQPGTRINKYLSEVGHCSRRAADALLEQGRITINGSVPEMGTRVLPGDRVAVDGVEVATNDQERIVIAYHKPVGIVCTTDRRREKDNIIDAINFSTRIYPIGRLDKMSEGLIFLTNDGDIVNDILRARYGHEKEYHVTVNQPIDEAFAKKMSSGGHLGHSHQSHAR